MCSRSTRMTFHVIVQLLRCIVCLSLTHLTAGLNQTGKGQGEHCVQTSECVENAQCWVHVCQCNIRFYPHQGQCVQRHGPGWLCTSSMQCVDSATCRQNHCQCDEEHYHTGNKCSPLLLLSPQNIRALQTTPNSMTITWDPPQLSPKSSTPHYSVSWAHDTRPEMTSGHVMTFTDLTPGSRCNISINTVIDENKTIKMSPRQKGVLRTTPAKPSRIRHSYSASTVSIYWSVEGQTDSFNGSMCSQTSCEAFTTPYTAHLFLSVNTSSHSIFYISARSGELFSKGASYTFSFSHREYELGTESPEHQQGSSVLVVTAFVSSILTALACLVGICLWKKGYCYSPLQKHPCCKADRVYEDLFHSPSVHPRTLYENHHVSHQNSGRILFENDMSSETIDNLS